MALLDIAATAGRHVRQGSATRTASHWTRMTTFTYPIFPIIACAGSMQNRARSKQSLETEIVAFRRKVVWPRSNPLRRLKGWPFEAIVFGSHQSRATACGGLTFGLVGFIEWPERVSVVTPGTAVIRCRPPLMDRAA